MALALGPYLTSKQAAVYLGYGNDDGTVNMDAFYHWIADHPTVKKYHRGRRLLFRVDDLDAAVETATGPDPFVARALTMAAGGKR